MYRPPPLFSTHLDDLIQGVGGPAAACRLLDITRRTLNRWVENDDVPQIALKLLWYAGPRGLAEAEAHFAFGADLARTEARAHARHVDELKSLLQQYVTSGAPAVELTPERSYCANDAYGAVPPTPTDTRRRRVG